MEEAYILVVKYDANERPHFKNPASPILVMPAELIGVEGDKPRVFRLLEINQTVTANKG